MSVDAELLEAVAASRGLPAEAGALLTGSSLAELEASADRLARLVETHGGEEPAPTLDPITAALRDKPRRKRLLAQAIISPRRQSRDESGRYTGFDGGARRPVPLPRDPARDHNQVVSDLATLASVFRGQAF